MHGVWSQVLTSAKRSPDALAVGGEVEWTYQALIERTADLSTRLRALAGPGAVVATKASGIPCSVLTTLACLSSGMCVLPIDPGAPAQWTAGLLADSNAAVLADLSNQSLRDHELQTRRDEIRLDPQIEQTEDRAHAVARVDSREHQMTGHCRLDGGARGFRIANFADENHVRVLA